jgi:hypothetical protein
LVALRNVFQTSSKIQYVYYNNNKKKKKKGEEEEEYAKSMIESMLKLQYYPDLVFLINSYY